MADPRQELRYLLGIDIRPPTARPAPIDELSQMLGLSQPPSQVDAYSEYLKRQAERLVENTDYATGMKEKPIARELQDWLDEQLR